MASYTISVDLSGIAQAAGAIVSGAMPMVQQAIIALGNEAAGRWKSAVMHAPLWQGEKEPYVNSIQVEQTGPFAVRVFADYKNAGPIEEGRPAVDQKKYLQTSNKVRRVANGPNKGKLFLIIPFRHNTPGNTAHAPAMPANVYEFASKLKPSYVTGKFLAPNVRGKVDAHGKMIMVERSNYKWGGQLPSGMAQKASPGNKTDRYAGMVRFDTTPGGEHAAQSTGAKRSSAYMTFRVMGEWSSGWVIPAKPGLFLAQKVAEEIQPLAEGALQEAMSRTVKGILGQS